MDIQKSDEHIKAIKNRLNAAYTTSGMSINSVAQTLSNMGYEITNNTLTNTLDTRTHKSVNLKVVLGMIALWELDPAYIFAPPDTQENDVISTKDLNRNEKIIPLDDDKYLGTFYGFMRNQHHLQNFLATFVLTISKSHGEVLATFKYRANCDSFENVTKYNELVYFGTPMLHTLTQNIHLHLHTKDGRSLQLIFNYRKYNVEKLFYRRGLVILGSTQGDHPPIAENFIFTARPLPLTEETIPFIQGLLAFSDSKIVIDKNIVTKLMSTNEKIKDFFDTFDYLLTDNYQKEVVYIHEQQLLATISAMRLDDRKNEFLKTLAVIQSHSYSPMAYAYEENLDYAYMIREDIRTL